MNKAIFLAMAVVLTKAALWSCFGSGEIVHEATTQTVTKTQTKTIVADTTALLNSLSADQRKKVLFPFAPQKTASAAKFKGGIDGRMTFVGEQYGQAIWSNFSVSDVPRPGGVQPGYAQNKTRCKFLCATRRRTRDWNPQKVPRLVSRACTRPKGLHD